MGGTPILGNLHMAVKNIHGRFVRIVDVTRQDHHDIGKVRMDASRRINKMYPLVNIQKTMEIKSLHHV